MTRIHFEKLVDEFEKGLDQALKEYDGEGLAAGLACVSSRNTWNTLAFWMERRRGTAGHRLCRRAFPACCPLLLHPPLPHPVPMDAAGTSAAAAAAAEEEAAAAAAAARAKAAGKAPAPSRRVTRSSKRRQSIEDSGDVDEAEGWECRHCTYRMVDGSTAECDMCGLPRQPS